jgi:hypothetical protein
LVTALASGAFLAAADPAQAFVSEVLQGREAGDDVAVLIATFDYEAVANQA